MILEGIAQKIMKDLENRGKISYFNLEDKKYIESIKHDKNNKKKELREKGVTISRVKAKYPIEIN